MGLPAANSSSKSSDTNETTPTKTTISSSSNNLIITNNNNNNGSARLSVKKSTDSDLKGSVIEFMKTRPFLWNKRHPGYKDHKKRDCEFHEFSIKIGCSVQEIKRVWHVLRTNFFRAHKMLLDKFQGGQAVVANSQIGTEKVWKYYTAMLYILEGSNLDTPKRLLATTSRGSCSVGGQSITERANDSVGRRVSSRVANNVMSPANKDTSASNRGSDSVTISNNGTSLTPGATSSATTPTSRLSTLNDSLLDDDSDLLYARSLCFTLKKFDPTTKEIVKLKFQEIIVDYMQRGQHKSHHQSKQRQHLSQLEPPSPSEIAKMEASLISTTDDTPANDVT